MKVGLWVLTCLEGVARACGVGIPLMDVLDRGLGAQIEQTCRHYHFDRAVRRQCVVVGPYEGAPGGVMEYAVPWTEAARWELEALDAQTARSQKHPNTARSVIWGLT